MEYNPDALRTMLATTKTVLATLEKELSDLPPLTTNSKVQARTVKCTVTNGDHFPSTAMRLKAIELSKAVAAAGEYVEADVRGPPHDTTRNRNGDRIVDRPHITVQLNTTTVGSEEVPPRKVHIYLELPDGTIYEQHKHLRMPNYPYNTLVAASVTHLDSNESPLEVRIRLERAARAKKTASIEAKIATAKSRVKEYEDAITKATAARTTQNKGLPQNASQSSHPTQKKAPSTTQGTKNTSSSSSAVTRPGGSVLNQQAGPSKPTTSSTPSTTTTNRPQGPSKPPSSTSAPKSTSKPTASVAPSGVKRK